MFEVVVRGIDGQTEFHTFSSEVRIGRDKTCKIRLGKGPNMVSRFHASLKESEEGVLLTDLGSTNGSTVDQVSVEAKIPQLLQTGQVIQIGDYTLEVSVVDDDTQTLAGGSQEPEVAPEVLYQRSNLVTDFASLELWDGKECELLVDAVIDETYDTKTFRLKGQEPMLFSFQPGQFLGISVEIDGKVQKRSYSISSSPARPHSLEVTIKRMPKGIVSNWLADNISVGDTLKARGPYGKFTSFRHPSPKMLLLAAGVGITPLMSMLRWVVDSGAQTDVVMFYSMATPADMVYRLELESIVSRHTNVRVIATATRSTDGFGWPGFDKRLTGAAIALGAPDFAEREVFLCGPNPFAVAMEEELTQAGLPPSQFHKESFGGKAPKAKKPGQVKADPVPAPAPAPGTAAGPVAIAPVPVAAAPVAVAPAPVAAAPVAVAPEPAPAQASGFKVHWVDEDVSFIADDSMTLLEQAESVGLEPPHSCREGNCGTCEMVCLEGSVTMAENELTDEELAERKVYICVAHATSNVSLES